MAVEFKDGIVSTSDVANVNDPVAISSTTAVDLLGVNELRLYVAITVLKNDGWVRLIPASQDSTTKKGIFVSRGATYEFPANFSHRTEISFIADSGTADVYVTEA